MGHLVGQLCFYILATCHFVAPFGLNVIKMTSGDACPKPMTGMRENIIKKAVMVPVSMALAGAMPVKDTNSFNIPPSAHADELFAAGPVGTDAYTTLGNLQMCRCTLHINVKSL